MSRSVKQEAAIRRALGPLPSSPHYIHQPEQPTVLKVEKRDSEFSTQIEKIMGRIETTKDKILDMLEDTVKELTNDWSTTPTRKEIEERWYNKHFKN